jgi:hypothetical protein
MFNDPRYSWEPKDGAAELDKARGYLVALTTAVNEVNRAATKLRGQKKAVQRYVESMA